MKLRFPLAASRILSAGLLTVGLTLCGYSIADAQRPSAPKLFPENTLAYIRVDDTRELKSLMAKTSMGRLSNDPQIKPIIREFYGSLVTSLENLQQQVGVNLDEILSIPNGELSIALVPSDQEPIVCVLLEAGDEIPPVEILLKQLEKRMAERGASRKVKSVGNINLVAMQDPGNRQRQFGYFINAGVLVACSNVDYAEYLAKAWTGNAVDHRTLADNRRFTSIMTRSVGIDGERPQVSYYLDPLAIAREFTKSNVSASLAMLLLPPLGIDGIQAIGGSMIFAPKDFDSIAHTHLLLSSPRKGVLQVLRPKSGSTEPEKWVHEEVAVYYTLNWNIAKTISAVRDLFDTFRGPDAFDNQVINNASKVFGVDFQKEVLDEIEDRVTLAQVFIRPAVINSGANLYAVHLKDPAFFAKTTLPKIYSRLKSQGQGNRWDSDNINNTLVYSIQVPSQSAAIRAPEPSFAVVGDCLIVSDSKKALEEAIYTLAGQREPLSKSLEFQMVRDRIARQVGDRETSIISFQRPEESLQLFYDLAADPANKERLRAMSETNPMFAALSNALQKHTLPPFEVISKYLAPAGSFVIEDESGLHSTSFSLRRE